MEMTEWLFFGIAFSGLIINCHSEKNRDHFINKVLDKVYAINKSNYEKKLTDDIITKRKVDIFVEETFAEIVKLIPETIKIPRFRENLGNTGKLCTEETTIPLKVGSTFSTNIDYSFKQSKNSKEKYIQSSIIADAEVMDSVSFQLYKDNSIQSETKSNFCKDSSKLGSVAYFFKGTTLIRLSLIIPDFSQDRRKIPKNCVVKINEIAVEKLGIRSVDSGERNAIEMGEQFWNSVEKEDIYKMMRIGIMKALLSYKAFLKIKFQHGWVCLSNDYLYGMIKDVEGYHFESTNTDGKMVYLKMNPAESDLWSFQSAIAESITSNSAESDNVDYTNSERKDEIEKTTNEKFKSYVSNTFKYLKNMKENLGLSLFQSVIVESASANRPESDDFTKSESKVVTDKRTGEKFTFTTYSPNTFKYLRSMLNIEEDFLRFFCQENLIPFKNPGKSKSDLFFSQNKVFIAKTLRNLSEIKTLQNLLPMYVSKFRQSINTLLPKFIGLYSNGMELDIAVMNNLMPAGVKIGQKYDLKGSTFNRFASKEEKDKGSPTFKDNDFVLDHPHGIFLTSNDYDMLMKTIKRDSNYLMTSKIVDYSLLLGLEYYTEIPKEKKDMATGKVSVPCESEDAASASLSTHLVGFQPKGIPALTAYGEKLKVYVGIIDVLQDFNFKKKLEALIKLTFVDKNVSLVEPNRYATRFQDFMKNSVFKKMNKCPLVEAKRKFKKWSEKKSIGKGKNKTCTRITNKLFDIVNFFSNYLCLQSCQ